MVLASQRRRGPPIVLRPRRVGDVERSVVQASHRRAGGSSRVRFFHSPLGLRRASRCTGLPAGLPCAGDGASVETQAARTWALSSAVKTRCVAESCRHHQPRWVGACAFLSAAFVQRSCTALAARLTFEVWRIGKYLVCVGDLSDGAHRPEVWVRSSLVWNSSHRSLGFGALSHRKFEVWSCQRILVLRLILPGQTCRPCRPNR